MTIGRANTVLVFGNGEKARALISAIIAKPLPKTSTKAFEFNGPAQFSVETKAHILETIVPLTDNIFSSLGLEKVGFELSIVNLEAAAVKDVGLAISGYSADVPVFLAIVSAVLGCEVHKSIVTTGHIASADGDIRMVKQIPQKLEAAVLSKKISRFFYPALDQDNSLKTFSIEENNHVLMAIAKNKSVIQIVAIRNIGELIAQTLTNEQTLLAGLKKGFFDRAVQGEPPRSNVEKVVQYFTINNYEKSWEILEEKLFQGQTESARMFLMAFTDFYINKKTYPNNIGSKLFQLLASLPPDKRRLVKRNPLISTGTSIKLSQFAKNADHNDII